MPATFTRGTWTCYLGPSQKYEHRCCFRAWREIGGHKQVISLEMPRDNTDLFDPDKFWATREKAS